MSAALDCLERLLPKRATYLMNAATPAVEGHFKPATRRVRVSVAGSSACTPREVRRIVDSVTVSQARFAMLEQYRKAFEHQNYRHRDNSIGNRIVDFVYEDLYAYGTSSKFRTRVDQRQCVVNPRNESPGVDARRGDGSFGDLVPGQSARSVPGYVVARGMTASVQIGTEIKIIAKAMRKNVGRVTSVLQHQAVAFREKESKAITIGVVGVNHAESYLSFEGDRAFPTTGKSAAPHPIQEADTAIATLKRDAAPHFDEFLFLRFVATNKEPYPFAWVDEADVQRDYGALLARVSRLYEQRF
jgi:hypothetical protein